MEYRTRVSGLAVGQTQTITVNGYSQEVLLTDVREVDGEYVVQCVRIEKTDDPFAEKMDAEKDY